MKYNFYHLKKIPKIKFYSKNWKQLNVSLS